MPYEQPQDSTTTLIDHNDINKNYSSVTLLEEDAITNTKGDIRAVEVYNAKEILKEISSTFIICIPVIISYLVEFLNPFITSYSVGWLGKEELASSALSAMFASITGWSFATGMTSCLDTLCSQAYTGSNDIKQVGVYAQRGFWTSMCLFLPISLTWYHAESILLAIGQTEVLSELCGVYLRWLLFAVPPFIGFECVKKFLQAQGIMNASANILIINLPVCAISNYLLVWHPSTSLGFIGAPIASSITSWSSFILGVLYVVFIDGRKAWGGFTWKAFSEWKPIIKLGLPGVIMVCSEWWAYEIMAFSASYISTGSLAAHGALSGMSGLLYQVAFGAGTVSSNIVGNILGKGYPNRAKRISLSCLAVGVIYGSFSFVMILILSPYLKSFYNDDPEIVEIVANVLPVLAILQFGDVAAGVANGILRGMGRQDIGAKLNFSVFYFVAIPFGILLAFHFDFGLKGLWIGFASGSALIALISVGLTMMADWDQEVRNTKARLDEDI
ncbi:MATE efflux family protein [Neoconidiobolus thromboides FSU 785]|nr:MATE efflux family protein [Neoconidiobolus thromboides FSU 785]